METGFVELNLHYLNMKISFKGTHLLLYRILYPRTWNESPPNLERGQNCERKCPKPCKSTQNSRLYPV